MTYRALSAVAIFCALALTIGTADARQSRHHQHGFICGLVQRLHFGLPPKYNLALAWADLTHTIRAPSAVVVQRRRGRALGGGPGGHGSCIVSLISQCRAIVTEIGRVPCRGRV